MTFKPVHIPQHLYFVTATITGWKHLFIEATYADILLNSLKWLREHERCFLYAFVLMPSHLHAMVRPRGEHTISTVLQNFGSFTAHRILKQLRRDRRDDLLAFFHKAETHPQKIHRIWEQIEAKNVYTPDFLVEKLEYIHNNPINKGWELVADRADYRYSNACFYDRGKAAITKIDDGRELL